MQRALLIGGPRANEIIHIENPEQLYVLRVPVMPSITVTIDSVPTVTDCYRVEYRRPEITLTFGSYEVGFDYPVFYYNGEYPRGDYERLETLQTILFFVSLGVLQPIRKEYPKCAR
jgi:hypothetical protein